MKTACIYHSVDLDGLMSAAIVNHWFNKRTDAISPENTIKFIGYDYGQPIPDLSGFDSIIMVDISFPIEKMIELQSKVIDSQFLWIDHHISAIKSYTKWCESNKCLYNVLLDTNYSACELTWMYFMQGIQKLEYGVDAINNEMPELVSLLGMYDTFRHMGTNDESKVIAFQYGAKAVINNWEDAYEKLTQSLESSNNQICYDILRNGNTIMDYLKVEARQIYNNFSFDVRFLNPLREEPSQPMFVNFICINRQKFNPINFGIDYHKDGYDGCVIFHFDGENYKFTIYNENNSVDCSIIAEMFGGGGHKGAAGFKLTPKQFDNFMKDKVAYATIMNDDISDSCDKPTPKDFKTRLIDEQLQLEEKLNKLNHFNISEKSNEINSIQKSLLVIQENAMNTYNEVLKTRIDLLD